MFEKSNAQIFNTKIEIATDQKFGDSMSKFH